MYEDRESRKVWYVTDDFTPTFTTGYAVNTIYPENPGPDDVLYIPGYGTTGLFWNSFENAHEGALQMIESEIKRTDEKLHSLRKKYTELLNPGYWKGT